MPESQPATFSKDLIKLTFHSEGSTYTALQGMPLQSCSIFGNQLDQVIKVAAYVDDSATQSCCFPKLHQPQSAL